MFISTDELDVINTRFGVYLAGNTDYDLKTVAAKFLCQCYDTVKNVTRTTGSSSFFIKRGCVNIFGASTGNMLAPICQQFNSNVSSDGCISRYLLVTTSAYKTSNELPDEILSVQPNIVHVLTVVRLLAQYKPIFVFGEYARQKNSQSSCKFLCCQWSKTKHVFVFNHNNQYYSSFSFNISINCILYFS